MIILAFTVRRDEDSLGENNMPPRKKAEDSSIDQLKVTLRYSSMLIWRRIQIRHKSGQPATEKD